jgi:RHS repeat-associated protein
VLDQLEEILTHFGYEEGKDFTRETLEKPVPLSTIYPEFVSTSTSSASKQSGSFEIEVEAQPFSTANGSTIVEVCEGLASEVYWYHNNYLGAVDLVTNTSGEVHQFFLYNAWGENMHEYNPVTPGFDSPYRFNAKELDKETGLAYYGARYYQNKFSVWLSVDAMATNDHNLPLTPYHFVNNNPVMLIDPDGNDWYEIIDEETGKSTIQWTDYSSQEEMDNNGVKGKYLGEAVVIMNGSYDEKLGTNGKIDGEGAVSAEVTIYGVSNSEDISTYDGLTMSSDPDKYTVISEGDYKAQYKDMATSPYGTKRPKSEGKATSLTYQIFTLDGSDEIPTQGGEINPVHNEPIMDAIFFHRTNWSGKATHSSQGCQIIDGRQWRDVEKQLGKCSNIYFRVRRN